MQNEVTIGGFTVQIPTTTTTTQPKVSLGCPTCPDLKFPSFPTRAEAQHIAGQHNLIAHGRANIAAADPELDTEDRALLARASGGVCIHVDADTSTECGDWTEENSRYCPAHTDEAEDAGEETSLDDWRKELDRRETDRRDRQRINDASPTPAPNTPNGFPDWLAEAVITSLENDTDGWATGTTRRGKTEPPSDFLPSRGYMLAHRTETGPGSFFVEAPTAYTAHCGCCAMRHGRPLNPGEHCSWCRRGLTHRITWAIRGSIGR